MYGDVILTRDVTEHGLRARDVGTVVERHTVAGVAEKPIRSSSSTVGVVILPAGALRAPTPADRPAARALTA